MDLMQSGFALGEAASHPFYLLFAHHNLLVYVHIYVHAALLVYHNEYTATAERGDRDSCKEGCFFTSSFKSPRRI